MSTYVQMVITSDKYEQVKKNLKRKKKKKKKKRDYHVMRAGGKCLSTNTETEYNTAWTTRPQA